MSLPGWCAPSYHKAWVNNCWENIKRSSVWRCKCVDFFKEFWIVYTWLIHLYNFFRIAFGIRRDNMKFWQMLHFVTINSTESDIFSCRLLGVVVAKASVYCQQYFFLNYSSTETRETIYVLFHQFARKDVKKVISTLYGK